MGLKEYYDTVLIVIGISIVAAMVGVAIGAAATGAAGPSTSLADSKDHCKGGDNEVSGMWASLLLTFMCTVIAGAFALGGKLKLSRQTTTTSETPPTNHRTRLIFAHIFMVLGVVTAMVEGFFVMEVRFKMFLCLPLLLQCIASTLALIVLLACAAILRWAWGIYHAD